MSLSPSEVEAIAERTAAKTIEQMFLTLGVDVKEPVELQKDFAHLRAWRQSIDQVRTRSLTAAVSIVVAGTAAAIWAAVTHKF